LTRLRGPTVHLFTAPLRSSGYITFRLHLHINTIHYKGSGKRFRATSWRCAYVNSMFDDHRHEVLLFEESLKLDLSKELFHITEKSERGDSVSENISEVVHGPTLSDAFLNAQSALTIGFGYQEIGYRITGHTCHQSSSETASFLYGEILPIGVHRALDDDHLNAAECQILLDLGCGIGKLATQSFIEFSNIKCVHGIELSKGRYKKCQEALSRLSSSTCIQPFSFSKSSDSSCELSENNRTLLISQGDLFEVNCRFLVSADILVLETDVPAPKFDILFVLLRRIKAGARLLTYLNVETIWYTSIKENDDDFFLERLPVNEDLADRF
jgi:hypothetical protein